jgi:translation initiation factor 1
MPTRRGNGLVYSSESGRACPHCDNPIANCVCQKNPRADRGDGIVRIRREVKGRRGKTVTAISGIPLPEDELRALAGDLKRSCGTGGSAKDGVIEIQGDHRDTLATLLRDRGYTVKLAGG